MAFCGLHHQRLLPLLAVSPPRSTCWGASLLLLSSSRMQGTASLNDSKAAGSASSSPAARKMLLVLQDVHPSSNSNSRQRRSSSRRRPWAMTTMLMACGLRSGSVTGASMHPRCIPSTDTTALHCGPASHLHHHQASARPTNCAWSCWAELLQRMTLRLKEPLLLRWLPRPSDVLLLVLAETGRGRQHLLLHLHLAAVRPALGSRCSRCTHLRQQLVVVVVEAAGMAV